VTLEFPAFVNVTLSTLFFPIVMLPKFKLETLVVRSAVAAIPVPLTLTVLGELDASLTMETSPDTAPAVFGEKTTFNVACFPEAIVRGKETPVTEIPVPATLALVIVAFDPPLFDMVTD
jgi:hypothetical protein